MLIREIEEFSKVALIDKIKVECSQFLSNISKFENLLYRGSRNTESWFKSPSPVNRQPVDSPIESQIIVNNFLTKAGATALRSNSLFCATDKLDANQFGLNTYYVIPVNGFSFTSIKNPPSEALDIINHHWIMGMGKKSTTNMIQFFINQTKKLTNEFEKQQAEDALQSLNDPEARFKNIGFLYHDFIWKFPLSKREKAIDQIVDIKEFKIRYGIEFNNLIAAMNLDSTYEMMIHGEVYAINTNQFDSEQEFRKALA